MKTKKKRITPDNLITDDLITTDAWVDIRYLHEEYIKEMEVTDLDESEIDRYAHFTLFEAEIKKKLIAAGFKKESLDDSYLLGNLVRKLNEQGREYAFHEVYCMRGYMQDSLAHCGYPTAVLIMNKNKTMFWVKPDVEAALRTLVSLKLIRPLLKDIKDVKIYMYTMELVVNLLRSGIIPKLAKLGELYSDKQSNTASRLRGRGGKTPADIKERNKQIIEHFKKSRLTASSFAVKYASKYDLKPRRVRDILNMAVGN